MSSYTHLYVKDRVVFSYHDGVYPEMFFLFSTDEFLHLGGNEAVTYTPDCDIDSMSPEEIDDIEAFVYAAPAGVLKDRLNILGFGETLLKESFEEALGDSIQSTIASMHRYADEDNPMRDHLKDHIEDIIKRTKEEIKELQELDYDTWMQQLGDYILSKRSVKAEEQEFRQFIEDPLEFLHHYDERLILKAILEHIDDEEVIVLELSDLEYSNLLDEQGINSELRKSGELGSDVPIIITEGTYDTEVLKGAIKILKPHIAPYVRFLDYDFKNEGGASFAVSTLKSFAAAGISNRIVAVFDNDSAAYEAVSALKGIKLPPQYKVIHYPDIDLANEYPTLGPQGNVMMNVNGLAGSIELYLGTDVLKDSEGNLMPVQWKGYMSKIKSYQGEVLNKALAQKTFSEKLKIAKTDRKNVDKQDWSGLNAILDKLIETLSNL